MPDDRDDPALGKTVAAQIETGDTLAAREGPRAPPAALDAYQVAGLLGRGGMGEVFLAHDPKVGRDIALKRMRSEMASPSATERFLREARIQARLEHPAILPVHDIGRDAAGVPYFTMKRLAGRTLADAMTGSDRTPRQRLLRVFADVALAIEFAHSRGVIHRDLKPANVMLGEFGEVYVLDWGLGRIVDDGDTGTFAEVESLSGQTQAGALLGTPGYMAPEQVRGVALGPAADIYALGAILFEVLAGEPLHPRSAAALQTTLAGVDGRPSQRGAEVAPELDALCREMLADDPAQRPTAGDVAERIERYLDGDRDLEKRRTLANAEIARAKRALEPGDAHRTDAMRAAGRALALDPTSQAAADLVTKLMFEPLRERPPALDEEVIATQIAGQKRQARTAAIAFVAIFAFLVAAALNGLRSWQLTAGIAAFTLLMATVALVLSRRSASASEMVAVAIGNAVLATLLSRAFGPIVVAPGIICVMAVSLTSYPQLIDRVWFVIGLLVIAWLLPVALEQLEIIQPTWLTMDGQIVSRSRLVHVGGLPTFLLLVFAHVATIVVIALFSNSLAKTRREAQLRFEEQAWHLRQFLSESVDAAR